VINCRSTTSCWKSTLKSTHVIIYQNSLIRYSSWSLTSTWCRFYFSITTTSRKAVEDASLFVLMISLPVLLAVLHRHVKVRFDAENISSVLSNLIYEFWPLQPYLCSILSSAEALESTKQLIISLWRKWMLSYPGFGDSCWKSQCMIISFRIKIMFFNH
jgi:hypothetical protein